MGHPMSAGCTQASGIHCRTSHAAPPESQTTCLVHLSSRSVSCRVTLYRPSLSEMRKWRKDQKRETGAILDPFRFRPTNNDHDALPCSFFPLGRSISTSMYKGSCVKTFKLSFENRFQNLPLSMPKLHYGQPFPKPGRNVFTLRSTG